MCGRSKLHSGLLAFAQVKPGYSGALGTELPMTVMEDLSFFAFFLCFFVSLLFKQDVSKKILLGHDSRHSDVGMQVFQEAL